MEMEKYRQLFFEESREHLARMGQLLVHLEQTPADRDTLDALFREAHSLKSMASAMGYAATTRLAHHLEVTLARWRDAKTMPAGDADHLLAGVDLLEGLLDDLVAERPEREIGDFLAASSADPPAGGAAPAAAPQLVYQVTVELAAETMAPAARALLILRDLEQLGEVLHAQPNADALRQGAPCLRMQVWLRTPVGQADLEARLRGCSDVELVAFVDDRRGGREPRRWANAEHTVRVRVDLLEQVAQLSGELLTRRDLLQSAAQARDWTRLDATLGDTAKVLDDLHQGVLQTRLLPLQSITGRLPRLVRDLARAGGKLAELRLVGGGVLIDREILEALAEPLMHLVRNAVDHGLIAGVQGEVTVAARLEPTAVLIEVSDTGRGLDPATLKQRAVERGLLTTSRAATFTDREALELICRPGFSTVPTVTEISGHGVGMDVVKTTVEQLGGTLRICSAPGAGCRIQLGFPVAPASGTYCNPQTFPDQATAAVAAPAPEVGHAVS